MIRTILISGITVASVAGAGTGALAVSGSTTTAGSGTTGVFSDHHRAARALLHHAVHGQVVTHDSDGYVRHDGVFGTVTAVSATSISVRASDGYQETFVVGDRTAVRKRTDGSGSRSSISAVHTGDDVAVLGRTANGTRGEATARVIVDGVPSR